MRALLSASGRSEIERMGKRQGWSVGIMEEMLDRLQSIVQEPLQKGGDLIMSSIPYTWREQATRRIRQAEGVISSVMPAVTTKDWSRLPSGAGDGHERNHDGLDADRQ